MDTKVIFDVKGMTCDHCVHAVTNAAKEVAGVTEVSVSLAENRAEVAGEFDAAKVIAAIAEEGYEASVRAGG